MGAASVDGAAAVHGDGAVTPHEQAVAAVVGAGLLVFSAVSALVGQVLGAEVSGGAIATGVFFVAGVLVSILGWMAVNLNKMSTDTAMLRGQMSDTREDVAELKADVRKLEEKHP